MVDHTATGKGGMMAELRLEWTGASREAWQRLLQGARAALQQGWSYGEALREGGVPVHRVIARDGSDRPLACVQVAERRFLGFARAAFLLRGPVWLVPGAEAIHEAPMLRDIRRRLGRAALIWAPETGRVFGRRPVITGYSTSWVDLSRGPEVLRARLAGKWRNALAQAERWPLEIRAGNAEEIRWLLDRNEEHRRRVGYRGPSRAFLGRLARHAAEQDALLALLAWKGAEPLAGILVVRHGAAATYEVGYVSLRGRELRAKHLLLWRAFELLQHQDVRWLDLGGVATDRAPGIARFKLGLGGEIATLPGTFLVPCLGWAGGDDSRFQDGSGE
jgi:hypothetical protein